MKKLYNVLLCTALALLLVIGVWSLFGNGETVSAVDGKTLAESRNSHLPRSLTAAICLRLSAATATTSRCVTCSSRWARP